ncbi:hypothetical protein ACQW02_02110 [Humitalea sp. 24SJ18S-53]|uniref:hypothetical protein n=1 Tax=Humitalea sp. 24SJ18S-53 TaxID=3422307 RepID=UPI003D67A6FB
MTLRPTVTRATIDLTRLADRPVLEPIRPVPLPEAQPLALLPLRLEYRLVATGRGLQVIDRAVLAGAATRRMATARPAQPLAAGSTTTGRVISRADLATAPIRDILVPAGTEELWVRWYPDENFAATGVQPPTATEIAALATLDAALGGAPWWRANETPAAATAWQSFVEVVGAVRAVHLKRGTAGPVPDPATRIGRIAGLPAEVHLFAMTGGALRLLGTGKPIPANGATPSAVRYTPDALKQPEGWLVNFARAVDLGMGVKITDKASVDAAKAAEWVIAVGLSGSAGPAEIADLLTDRIATGGFAVLKQDTQTNATSGGTTGYTRAQTAPLDYLVAATEDEHGLHDTPKLTAAELLAEALGIDQAILRRAEGAADQAHEDARAMLRVVGPILLDGLLDGQTFSFNWRFPGAGTEVDENSFIDTLASVISGRGVLPPLRVGHTAYGLLPMTKVNDLNIDGETELTAEERQVFDTLAMVAKQARAFLPAHARAVVPVLAPDDPAASDKLAEILKTNPVSKRLEVVDDDAPSDRARGIGCPYVQAGNPAAGQGAADYLFALARTSIAALPDPDETDATWPLLYRLARLSLTRNLTDLVRLETAMPRGTLNVMRLSMTPTATVSASSVLMTTLESRSLTALATDQIASVSSIGILKLRRASAAFAAALDHLRGVALRPGGIAQLEMLLFETIDLFQHRLDAVGVGLAYARLARARRRGRAGLSIGYYGMLTGLRPAATKPAGDGYIQAPSQGQALTAAVLRSAYRRHRAEGAFAINLSGPRIRRALRLTDLLSKGHSLGEGLGMLGERWLHEQHQDALIFPLRGEFRIPDESGEATAGRRVFDGQAFAASSAAETGARAALRNMLREELDTVADLVMAEAAHLRAQGLAPAANAWLQVLSGGPIPGMPSFIRTQRSGHGSTHRLAMAIPLVDPFGTLRECVEPGLAQLARTLLPKFDAAALVLRPARPAGGTVTDAVRLELARDLRMTPIDLVVGGLPEVQKRARALLIETLLADPAALPGLTAAATPEAFVAGEASFTADLTVGPAPVDDLAATAERLRRVIARGRPLEATDLNAAAPGTAGLLDEAGEVAALEFGIAALKQRAGAALTVLAALVQPVPSLLTAYLADTLEFARLQAAASTAAAIDTQRARAETRRRALGTALRALAVSGQADALEPLVLEEDAESGTETRQRVEALLATLETRRAALAAAAAVASAGRTTASAARGDLTALVTALQGVAGGAALPVLPPLPRDRPALLPALGTAKLPATALAEWAAVRERIADGVQLAAAWKQARLLPVTPEATAEDPATTPDPQSEAVSPRSWHFGQFIGEAAFLAGTAPIAGSVMDEWAEQRPSSVQSAAIAVNYDAPQSEPPSAILLAVPPNPSLRQWTPLGAAEMVGEAITWMQVRAVSGEMRAASWTMLPGANRVPLKSGDPAKRRIPPVQLRLVFTDILQTRGDFAISAALGQARAGTAAAGIVERGFGSQLKE